MNLASAATPFSPPVAINALTTTMRDVALAGSLDDTVKQSTTASIAPVMESLWEANYAPSSYEAAAAEQASKALSEVMGTLNADPSARSYSPSVAPVITGLGQALAAVSTLQDLSLKSAGVTAAA